MYHLPFTIWKKNIKDIQSSVVSRQSSKWSIRRGFTLIELIVVFSVIAIISTIGVASFEAYINSQKLQTTALTMKTVLRQARSEASNQVKPSNCLGSLQGYELRICSGGLCNGSGDYELDAICGSQPNGILVSSAKLPTGITIDATTIQKTYRFIVITGGVVQGGTIVLDGANGAQQRITVTTTGVIQ